MESSRRDIDVDREIRAMLADLPAPTLSSGFPDRLMTQLGPRYLPVHTRRPLWIVYISGLAAMLAVFTLVLGLASRFESGLTEMHTVGASVGTALPDAGLVCTVLVLIAVVATAMRPVLRSAVPTKV
jgi:hypothetical protein